MRAVCMVWSGDSEAWRWLARPLISTTGDTDRRSSISVVGPPCLSSHTHPGTGRAHVYVESESAKQATAIAGIRLSAVVTIKLNLKYLQYHIALRVAAAGD
jgi:hypothetical protein